ITLNASLLRQEKSNVVIEFTVTDTGIGIRQESLDKLFQPYSQAEKSTTRRFGGTGLGLAICKQLAELMDGSITAESQEGKGSSFIVQLTLGVPAQNTENSSYQIPELAGKNALVVDDNHTALEIISELTISAGLVVTLASSGQEALDILNNSGKIFDLAIIDWQMPGMNGTATAREIQKCKLARDPHLIAVTSHNRENIIQDCLNNGFASVVTKPINPNDLITAIRKAFGLSVHTPVRKAKEIVPNLTGTNILLVEDQELNQEIMINLLERTKTKVTIANNGKEAVELIQEKHFDLVLMDIEMPVMNGLDATRAIRALDDKDTAGVPILAMTANAMQEDLENSKSAGMNDHITKPINPGLLYRKIRDYISRSNKESERTSLLEQLNQIDKIDTFSGLGFAGGDKELYMKTIARFLEKTPEQIAELNLALNKNDTDSAAAALHTIKGIAGTIGACKLKERADITEKNLLENPQDKSLEQSISDMVSELESLKADIEKVINTPTGDIK
ncbi:MAG: response regulator, partial [Sedimentisphaerales bacterium]|nr:response regulator [Sedimentisphaerales bacterium]